MEDTININQIKKSWRKKLLDASHSKYGMILLSFIAFIESAFFPIPPDFFIVPMIVAKPDSWKKIALWVSIFSVLGSFLGYYIGFALFESFGQLIIEKYQLADEMIKVGKAYNDNAFWSLLVAAFTPIPYKLFTIAAGVFKVNLLPFTIASVVGRTARYILVSYLAHLGGRSMENQYIKKMTKWMWISVFVIVVIVVAFFVIKK